MKSQNLNVLNAYLYIFAQNNSHHHGEKQHRRKAKSY